MIDREKAIGIFEAMFGRDTRWAIDPFGNIMCKDDYLNKETKRDDCPYCKGYKYNFGWVIDLIMPVSEFIDPEDADINNNYEPMHWQNAEAKGNNYPDFVIDGNRYVIVSCPYSGEKSLVGYGIVKSNGERVDRKGVLKMAFPYNKIDLELKEDED